MVAIASPISAPAPTSFCDRRFKCLRLAVDCILKIYLSIFYTALSYLAYPFSEKFSHQASDWSHIYALQGGRFFVYLKYGNQLIDFSFNFSLRMHKKTMEEAFDKEDVERWTQNAAPFGSLIKEKLHPMRTRPGCCVGMSLDLISTYLQEVRKGNSSIKAIRIASSKMSEGSTEEAELAQIFATALDPQPAIDRRVGNKWILGFHGEELATVPIAPQLACKEDYLCDSFGLREGKARGHLYSVPQETESPPKNYVDLMNRLENGAYQIMLESREMPGHSLALIKTSDTYYFFDPMLGTLAIDPKEAAAAIWENGHPYFKGKELIFRLVPFTLA